MQKILITGANGFVGHYLINELGSAYDIVACYFDDKQPQSVKPTNSDVNVSWLALDISDRESVFTIIKDTQPDFIIHLAAISHVPTATSNAELTWQTNVMGSVAIFDAVKAHQPQCCVLYISSSEVYGKSFAQHERVDESVCLQPMNVYATTKASIDMLAENYASLGVKIIRIRPFNHIGPGQAENFVVPAFASQIARIEAGKQEPEIKVGNLSAIRDLLDVRDVVRAYALMIKNADKLKAGTIINIASGKGYKIEDLLNKLLKLSNTDIKISIDESRLRPVEIKSAVGNADAAKQLLDWQAQFSIDDSVADVLEEWRAKI